MAVTVEISSIDRTSFVKFPSLAYSDLLEGRGPCSFTMVATTKPYYRPVVGEPVVVKDDGTTIYAGTIEDIEDSEPGLPDVVMQYKVTVVDFSQIPDRFTVAEIYDGELAGDIIKDIIEVFVNLMGESIDVTEVQDGLEIERIVFGYRKASDCFRDLSKLIGFSWYIDFDKKLHFFDRSTFDASFDLAVGSNNFRKLKVKRKRSQYRNVQYAIGGEDRSDSQTEDFKGDGTRQTFTLALALGAEPTVTLNAAGQTVGIREVDDPNNFQWYWSKTEKEITQRKSDAAIDAGDTLQVVYIGLFPLITLSEDAVEIAERSGIEGGSGRYEAIVSDDAIEDRDLALQKAEGLLRRFGEIPAIVTYETDVDGLRSGMLQEIVLPDFVLDGEFLIDSVKAKVVPIEGGDEIMRYSVRALSGEHLGSWHDFFRQLQNAGRSFKLREGETLTLIRQKTETINLAEVFSKSDPLEVYSDDPYTGAQFGTATNLRGSFGELISDPEFTTYGSQMTNPPVDS